MSVRTCACMQEIAGGGGRGVGAKQIQSEHRTEIVMGLITLKWNKLSTKSLRKTALPVQKTAKEM